MKLPVTSEFTMQRILNFPSFIVRKSTWKMLSEINIPCHFFYGDNDFMERNVARELINSQKIKGTYNVIPNCGYMIAYENPRELYRRIK